MVHRCCVSSCGMNVRVAEAKGLSYHSFPNKEPVREQWIMAVIPHLDRPETFKVVSKYTRVCSRHFRKKDYSVDIKKRARLNANAVPSVFPRKNTPVIIPNVLPPSPKGLKGSKDDPIRPFVHHSSEESLFSTEDDVVSASVIDAASNLNLHSSTGSSESPAGEGDIMAHIVEIGDRVPSVLEIENLANHFNSSLLTTVPITLSIELGDLHIPDTDLSEKEGTTTMSFSFREDSPKAVYETEVQDDVEGCCLSSHKFGSQAKKKKAIEDVRLTGVTKKHRKEKMCGRFSVERFSNSDKDIEYYTGFNSYRNFEAFFRSLEAYVERLRVTDVMFGVTNLDKLQPEASDCSPKAASSSVQDEFISPLPPPPAFDEPQKRRPFHGRSMSRIDELFMTVIRLKRKLPEKVLGHMFCISQPTVSRIIRAWTVLLSKLIDCYHVESSVEKNKNAKTSTKSNSEHSYTNRGMGIPESFRQLFHSDLAQSVIVTSLNAKDKKSGLSNVQGSISKRVRKTRLDENDLFSESNCSTNLSSISSLCLEPDECADSSSESSLMFSSCADFKVEESENEFLRAADLSLI